MFIFFSISAAWVLSMEPSSPRREGFISSRESIICGVNFAAGFFDEDSVGEVDKGSALLEAARFLCFLLFLFVLGSSTGSVLALESIAAGCSSAESGSFDTVA